MKILEAKYPMGTLPYQKSPGRYIDDKLYSNLQILARKITDNQNWVGVISSSTESNRSNTILNNRFELSFNSFTSFAILLSRA